MSKIHNIRKALLLLSLTIGGGSAVHAFVAESFFAPFNELFEEMDIHHAQPTKSRETAEKDLRSRVTTLQEEAKRLSKAADELASNLDKKGTDTNTNPINLATIDESHLAINATLRGIKREIQSVRRARHTESIKQAPAYSLRTQTDEKKELFVVTATLPSIAKEDLKITVKTSDEFGIERQTLLVTAEPKTTKASTPSGFSSSSSITQARYLNGRREELVAENGNVTITVDLPKDASNDLADVQKTMSFENNTLILSFPMTPRAKKKETELRFLNNSKADSIPAAQTQGALK